MKNYNTNFDKHLLCKAFFKSISCEIASSVVANGQGYEGNYSTALYENKKGSKLN